MFGARRAGLMAMAMAGGVLCGCVVAPPSCAPPPAAPTPRVEYSPARWSDLPGWAADDLTQAWPAFLASCRAVGRRAPWRVPCAAARGAGPTSNGARRFFERYFEPYRLISRVGRQAEGQGLITGYFEPLLYGSRTRTPQFDTPLYSPPPDLLTVDLASVYPELAGVRVRGRLAGNKIVPYYSRATLARDPALAGHVIAWVGNALDAFFLEVQGSGRVELPDGTTLRLHYADENGYPYRSIGRFLVEQGDLTPAEATMAGIRGWAFAHPDRVTALLDEDPSVIFFRAEPLGDPARGPPGSLGVPLSAGRSIAVDPGVVPLGAPVFLSTTFPGTGAPLQRLVIAQDTGGAIRGAVRADLYWGTGASAAAAAGAMRQSGSLWLLWPKEAPLPRAQPPAD
ncbi:MAG: murein transglycosylase A [Steroidobacteraceae bacterium]